MNIMTKSYLATIVQYVSASSAFVVLQSNKTEYKNGILLDLSQCVQAISA